MRCNTLCLTWKQLGRSSLIVIDSHIRIPIKRKALEHPQEHWGETMEGFLVLLPPQQWMHLTLKHRWLRLRWNASTDFCSVLPPAQHAAVKPFPDGQNPPDKDDFLLCLVWKEAAEDLILCALCVDLMRQGWSKLHTHTKQRLPVLTSLVLNPSFWVRSL